MAKRTLTARPESWATAKPFTISRGTVNSAEVITVEIRAGCHRGRGECLPYPRYGETIEGTLETIESLRQLVEEGADGTAINQHLGPCAARNALDCALWDLEAKLSESSIFELLGIEPRRNVITAFTLSLDTPDAMAEAAQSVADRALLKVKLGGEGDLERLAAVREAAPNAALIVDANEGWRPQELERNLSSLAELGVSLVEQPLPASNDAMLADVEHPVPIAADESCHDSTTIETLAGRYDVVNLKLDKTGGLTEALKAAARAKELGLGLMIGCMRGTSLAMAPALMLAGDAAFVDLDGPLLLAEDREHGLHYHRSTVSMPSPLLWG